MRRNKADIRETRRDREGAFFLRAGRHARGGWHAHGFAWAWLVALLTIVLSLAASPARAGGPLPPELEFEWARVRAKDNAAWTGSWPHVPFPPPVTMGAVGYNYRIATKPVSNRQWFQFVNAYAAQFGHPTGQTGVFLGSGIVRVGGEYILIIGSADRPVVIGWRFAAIYTNWLHNGKADTPEAFNSGAYDVSTFGANPDGTLTDQRTRSAGAQYWIPSSDEWAKAVYYDPNRHGEGQGGYWLHPGMQDTPLTTGLPEEGGQTNARITNQFPPGATPAHALNVGMYPHVQSPWGALDGSGGAEEWLEDISGSGINRLGRPSHVNISFPDNRIDHIGRLMNGGMTYTMNFRVAAVIPAPGSVVFAPLSMIFLASRRTRRA